MATVTIALEGTSDSAVLAKVLGAVGHSVGQVHGGRGKTRLDRSVKGYNNAARFAPWLVLRDLDQDAPCAPVLREALLPAPSRHMVYRVAVRAAEAWLMADSEALGRFLGVTERAIPFAPDELRDPKNSLVDLARRSRFTAIRSDMVPSVGMRSRVGPGYPSRIAEFATHHWRPLIAGERSPSLSRCLARLQVSWVQF